MNQKTWTIILNVYLEIILIANVNTDSIVYIPGRDSVPLHTSVHQQYVSCLQNTIFVTIFDMWLDFSWRKLKIKILVNLSDSPRDIYSTEFHIQYSHPDLTIPVTVWWSMGNYTKQKSWEALICRIQINDAFWLFECHLNISKSCLYHLAIRNTCFVLCHNMYNLTWFCYENHNALA